MVVLKKLVAKFWTVTLTKLSDMNVSFYWTVTTEVVGMLESWSLSVFLSLWGGWLKRVRLSLTTAATTLFFPLSKRSFVIALIFDSCSVLPWSKQKTFQYSPFVENVGNLTMYFLYLQFEITIITVWGNRLSFIGCNCVSVQYSTLSCMLSSDITLDSLLL